MLISVNTLCMFNVMMHLALKTNLLCVTETCIGATAAVTRTLT